jgi:gas vesicle protein
MARRRTRSKELPEVARETGDRVREAVERTVQATMGSAERTRSRAVDELVDTVGRSAEGLVRSGKVVREAVEERMPATQDDVRELKSELRRISRRLEAIEERLPAPRSSAKGRRAGGQKRS